MKNRSCVICGSMGEVRKVGGMDMCGGCRTGRREALKEQDRLMRKEMRAWVKAHKEVQANG